MAVGRGGGLPIVDGLQIKGPHELKRQIEVLSEHGVVRFGLRLDPSFNAWAQPILETLERPLDLVVLAKRYHSEKWRELPASIVALRRRARRVFCEVVSQGESDEAAQAGIDGLVAKGNEAAGRVGSESTFVLLQRLCRRHHLEVWAYGGIGPHSAAACAAAGAGGIVLDNQLAMARELALPESIRLLVAAMDGGETVCLGESVQNRYRVHARRGAAVVRRMRQLEAESPERFSACIQEALEDAGSDALLPMGQDAAFAARLAANYGTVIGILRAYRQTAADNVILAAEAAALAKNSPLAQVHGARYAIVQGAMTRVSDVPAFVAAVADAGALPFLSLGLRRKPACVELLRQTNELLGDRSWGVGILAFASPELYREQLDAVLDARPRFAVLAGGRPIQARVLEKAGVATYIHTPSPGLFEMFLREGARRFVFEGRECGGHVGPLSSFVLWDLVVQTMLDYRASTHDREPIDILFAGGIHDGLSAAMTAALAASMTAAGTRIGVLMGTAYLFTNEAVETGAITPMFQEEALRCQDSVLLDSEGGYAIRCVSTLYCKEFHDVRRQLLASGIPPDEVRQRLENLHVGRLRIATQGTARVATPNSPSGQTEIVKVSAEQQQRDGLYMMGQAAALRSNAFSMQQLHREVADESLHLLRRLAAEGQKSRASAVHDRSPEPVALVGMACILPGATNLSAYWSNIVHGSNAVTEVPAKRWRSEQFYDPKRNVSERMVSKWGGFVEPIPIDPAFYGIPPASVDSTEPIHLLTLEAARQALIDAGYEHRPFPRERTSVIVAAGGGFCDRGIAYQTRYTIEHYLRAVPDLDSATRDKVLRSVQEIIPAVTEDSLPGILGNVAAGRVANRFNLGGSNYSVDAACGSSLAALQAGVLELRYGSADVALVGSTEGAQNIPSFMLFSKARALSPTGRCRPFDDAADGIALSEGVAFIVLKRLADAQRDGDRVYAVMRAVAGSSDGREMSLTAPAVRGQRRALERVYSALDISAATVSLVEAHGTGTVVGDRTELQTLREVFERHGAASQGCALGSVKSQIGHTKNTAGLASLIKVTKALHHAVLPPTLFEQPNKALRDRSTPFYLSRRARAWFRSGASPRRAAVSSFGFGGTNFHALLEEYPPDVEASAERPAELLVFRANTKAALVERLQDLRNAIGRGSKFRLIDLARALERQASEARGECRLAIVADSAPDHLPALLDRAVVTLDRDEAFSESEPIIFGEGQHAGKLCFLFPGQGSQELNMLEDLALSMPSVRRVFEAADDALAAILPKRLTQVIFPPPAYSPEEEAEQRRELGQTWLAQPALGAASYALFSLLTAFGLRADAMAGHSYGEYVALCASGAITFDDLVRLSERRGRVVQQVQGRELIGMVAVQAPLAEVQPLVVACPGVSIAGENAPCQTILGGAAESIATLCARLEEHHISHRRLAMSAGFHIPQAQAAADLFERDLKAARIQAPKISVYSNCHASVYPGEPDEIRRTLVEQLTHPLRFKEMIEAMYEAGVRMFVEVGPGNVLSGLTRQILPDHPILVVSLSRRNSDGALADLLRALGTLYTAGVPVRLDGLFSDCALRPLCIQDLADGPEPLSPTTWMVDGGSAEPVKGQSTWHRVQAAEAVARATATPETMSRRDAEQGRPSSGAVTSTPGSMETVPGLGLPEDPVQPMSEVETRGAAPASATLFEAFERTMHKFLDHQAESQRRRQEIMSQFLATQRAMLATLGSSNARSGLPASTAEHFAKSASMERRREGTVKEPPEAPRMVNAPPERRPQAVPGPIAGPGDSVLVPPADRDLGKSLLDRVSRRTGYPVDMLNLDQNLEADLGIDSIKRTEIFAGMLEEIGSNQTEHEREEYFLALARFRTLREVLGWIEEQTPRKASMKQSESQTASLETAVAGASAGSPKVNANGTLAGPAVNVEDLLLTLVSQRTGYPVDMLNLDQNLEADLGIDSIKRTEIFAGMLGSVGLRLDDHEREECFLALARFHTLREILKWLGEREDGGNGHAGLETMSSQAPIAPTDGENQIGRYVVQIRGLDGNHHSDLPLTNRVVLLTADGLGVGERLANELRGKGNQVIVVRHAHTFQNLGLDHFEVDLHSRGALEMLRERIGCEHGRVDTLCHLLPLSGALGTDQNNLPLKSLFLLCSTFGLDLCEARGSLLAATSLGGRFGIDGRSEAFSTSPAAIPGLVKSVAQEWPQVRLKIVDCDRGMPADALAATLLTEIESGDSPVEVGYADGVRVTPVLVPSVVDRTHTRACHLDDNSVVLITGGARGIAAKVALELTRAYHSRLILTGRAPLPGPEGAETISVSSPDELKVLLGEGRRRRGEVPTPALIDIDYHALINARQTRQTLEMLNASNVRYEYRSLDVRDEKKFEQLIAELYEVYGRIDGVLHAAGIVEDGLLLGKSPESFDRVFNTKLKPAITLARTLRSDTLQFLVFFSSVAARFGCAGSSDYAAANEALNRLACKLNREWPARVVAINWGPWAEVGMATQYSEAFHRKRGFSSLSVAAGCRRLLEELAYGAKSEPEVALYASPSSAASALPQEGLL